MADRKVPHSLPSIIEAPSSPPKEYSVYVYDIARGVTDENLKEEFSKIGDVHSALIVKNKFTGETKGYGFVRFYSMDDVYNALDCTSLPTFEDSISHKSQTVKVTIADPKDTLYIGNIPRGWTESEVIRTLHEVGVEPPRKFRFSERKTHGYATYTDHDTALNALKNIQRPPSGVQHPPFTAYLAPPKFSDSKSAPSMKVLFVRGTGGMSREELQALFGGPEVVERVVVPLDSARRTPLGHAFVHYLSSKHAADAMKRLNNTLYGENKLSIEWSLPKVSSSKRESTHHPRTEHAPHMYPYPYSQPYPYYPEFYPPYASYDPYYGGGSRGYGYPKVDKRTNSPHRDVFVGSYHSHTGAHGKTSHNQKSSRFLPY